LSCILDIFGKYSQIVQERSIQEVETTSILVVQPNFILTSICHFFGETNTKICTGNKIQCRQMNNRTYLI